MSIWLKPVSYQLLTGNAAKHAQPIYPVYPPGNKKEANLHCTMCEIKRAVLVSLHVSLPCARSCFTCNANRYLQNKHEQRVT